MHQDNVEIRESRNGKGIFAAIEFQPGEIIYQIKGKLVSTDIIHSMRGSVANNCFRYDKDLYINPSGKIGNYQNHSCEPNSIIDKKTNGLYIKAFRKIHTGEEITIDYSTIVADDDIVGGKEPYQLVCNCGEELCRGTVRNFSSLPGKIKEKYLASNAVPMYIKKCSNI